MRCFASRWTKSFGMLAIATAFSVGAGQMVAAQEQSSVLVPSVLVDNAVTAPVSQVAEVAPSASAAAEKLALDVTPRSVPLVAAPHEPATQEQIDATGEKVRRVLDHYYARKQHVDRRTPWEVMHWAIAFGTNSYMHRGPEQDDVSAIGWLGWNGRCKGQGLLYVDAQGRLGVLRGPGVQGHDGQLLAIYAQSRVQADYPMRVGGKSYTVADLIEFEKRTCEPGSELTFKLIGLAHYLPLDAKWEDEQKREWSIERLVREELAQNVIGAACGGTHRMTGYSYAVRKAQAAGKPLTGDFARAEKFVNDYHRYAWTLQNADGSFSTDYFRNRAASSDIARRLETSGHTLEWLAYSLSDAELKQNRCLKAVNYVADVLLSESERDWHMGALGHALHGLAIYERRVHQAWKPKAPETASLK